MKTGLNLLKMKKVSFLALICILSVFDYSNKAYAAVFTVNVNDGGWPAAGGAGTLNKAISDFNAAGAGAHTINVLVNVSLTNPAFWTINNAAASLTINGNGNTVDGPGYNSWAITVNQLSINNWTMTAGFGTAATTLAGAGGHSFTNTSIANVAFTFTTNNNTLTNSTFLGPGGTYTMSMNNNQLNTITGCYFDQMALRFTTSINNAISNSRFTRSMLSFLTGSNNNTVYGSKFNTNAAGTALVASGIAADIVVNASTGNIIGANTVPGRNIFALASTNAISIVANSNNTQVVGNYFGTDVNGTASLSGAGTNSTISINASQNVIVDYNVITSMLGTTGGAIEVVAGVCSGLRIRYNKIGVDVNGTGGAAFGNASHGIVLTAGTVNNLDIIGNTISRSVSMGIRSFASSTTMVIQDNFIGSNSTGLYDGVNYGNGHGGIVFSGGTLSGVSITGNVIVRNGWVTQDNNSCGIYVNTDANPLSITNNKIGVYADNSSTAPVGNYSGNSFAGIFVFSTSFNITISGNVIGRNGFGTTRSHGIATAGTISNIAISNNYIGVTPGSVAIGNGQSGIDLQNATTGAISGNYIGANEGRRADIPAAGLAMANGTNQITVSGNIFGVMPNGTAAGQQLNGSYDGSAVRAEGTTNRVSLNNNTLANSVGNGVNVVAGADYVQIFDNSIFCNTAKGINLNCGGGFPNTPGNSSFGCGTITLNVFTPVPSVVNGGRPANSVVYVYGTNACSAGSCGTNPQGQTRFTAATTTYPTGSTWDYNNGSLMYNDITALAVGTGANCNGAPYCRTSEFSNCIDNTLPVSMLYFTVAALQDKTALLNWATISEENNAFFSIERSKDGVYFEPIGVVSGSGNADNENNYSFVDSNPYTGITYYRIRQTDVDGRSSVTEVKSVSITDEAIIAIYPNPNQGLFHVRLVGFTNGTVEVLDLTGRQLLVKSIDFEGGNTDLSFDSKLSAGSYFIKVSSQEGTRVEKFIVN